MSQCLFATCILLYSDYSISNLYGKQVSKGELEVKVAKNKFGEPLFRPVVMSCVLFLGMPRPHWIVGH